MNSGAAISHNTAIDGWREALYGLSVRVGDFSNNWMVTLGIITGTGFSYEQPGEFRCTLVCNELHMK